MAASFRLIGGGVEIAGTKALKAGDQASTLVFSIHAPAAHGGSPVP
jgi:hypothetical protein